MKINLQEGGIKVYLYSDRHTTETNRKETAPNKSEKSTSILEEKTQGTSTRYYF
ncbi:hypothetical protein CANARDRAFT_30018 [[Candida] arabinofermentans NRRL YB-2248]|uniref:Uncharacterized protein n=1 Tax=[Candida] arabinofermentans NRRL YB-2248 TaxID=983967 RepID=A0A1E4SV63_9ASCO|nr:hypothetical protein CANARDRAFT_30018 [[Candida] arabinofermentans NRRL YB-2248]